MAEFSLIQRYLTQQHHDDSVVLGIGDDAAILNCPEGYQLVQTIDTMVHNVHFDDSFTAAQLAHKLLHVNLSDIAAMGAAPQWATVALTLPTVDEQWLSDFSATLYQQCQQYGVNLVGGDTTSGPLCVSLNLTGIVKRDHYLTRQQAQINDDIYVSGTLGDAALALHLGEQAATTLQQRLHTPTARVSVGQQLFGLANSCIDLSDGLLADLQHICQQSHCGANIWLENLPLSSAYQDYVLSQQQIQTNMASATVIQPLDFALNGGDDYELCFTAAKNKRDEIQRLKKSLSCDISLIGEVVEQGKRVEQFEHSTMTGSVIHANYDSKNESNNIHRNSCDSHNNSDNSDNTSNIQTLLHGQPYHCARKGWEHFAD